MSFRVEVFKERFRSQLYVEDNGYLVLLRSSPLDVEFSSLRSYSEEQV